MRLKTDYMQIEQEREIKQLRTCIRYLEVTLLAVFTGFTLGGIVGSWGMIWASLSAMWGGIL